MSRGARVLLVVALAIASFAAGALFNQRRAAPPSAGERRVLRYICPMHPQYTSDRPGDAPCCGMRLEPVYAGSEGAPRTTAASGPVPGAVPVTPEK